MYKKMFLFFSLFFLFSCSENNENIAPQNNTPDIEITKISDLDLVKKYFNYLSKKDYLSAYNLKETDKTLDDFISVYSDSESFIKYSSEKLDNGNIKSINIIDNIPYEGIFEVVDGKIKTISTIELTDYVYSNGILREKKIEEKYPLFTFFPNKQIENIDWGTVKNGYYILYIPEKSKFLEEKLIIRKNFNGGIYHHFNISIENLLSGNIPDNTKSIYTRESNPSHGNENTSKMSKKNVGNTILLIDGFNAMNKRYYFALRINNDIVIVYQGDQKPKITDKKDLTNIFHAFNNERIGKLKDGTCYSVQNTFRCLSGGKEKIIKIKNKLWYFDTAKEIESGIYSFLEEEYFSSAINIPYLYFKEHNNFLYFEKDKKNEYIECLDYEIIKNVNGYGLSCVNFVDGKINYSNRAYNEKLGLITSDIINCNSDRKSDCKSENNGNILEYSVNRNNVGILEFKEK